MYIEYYFNYFASPPLQSALKKGLIREVSFLEGESFTISLHLKIFPNKRDGLIKG